MAYPHVAFLLFSVMCCDHVLSYWSSFSVDAVFGQDDSSCLVPDGPPCQTLEYVQSYLQFNKKFSVRIEILPPKIKLKKALNFTDFTDLSITGTNESSPAFIHCNSSDGGLVFLNVTGFSFHYVHTLGCGAVRDYNQFNYTLVAALFLIQCNNVNLSNIFLDSSNGTGILVLNTQGNVVIENTTIINSSLHVDDSRLTYYYGGSGISIMFNPCFLPHKENSQSPNDDTYTLNHVSSSWNTGQTTNNNQQLPCNSSPQGGGISIILGYLTENVNITIQDSQFLYNSIQSCGAGLLIATYGSSEHNKITVLRSNISNNRVVTHKVGGGMQIIFSTCFMNYTNYDQPHSHTGVFKFLSCHFKNNSAYSGGGFNIYYDRKNSSIGAVQFYGCEWYDNKALKYGSAVHVLAGILVHINTYYPELSFENCKFINNKVGLLAISSENLIIKFDRAGTFFSTDIPVLFSGNTTFAGNNGTALYLSGSAAYFSPGSQVMFINNSGNNGGAVSLIGRSYLYLNGISNLSFINNSASNLGGAIYYYSVDSVVYQPCFISHDFNQIQSRFLFSGNNAGGGRGYHLFVSSYTTCRYYCSTTSDDPLHCIGVFTFTNPHTNNTIATLPTNFSLPENTISLFPGLPHHLPLKAVDSGGNPVPDLSYRASIVNNSLTASVDSSFEYVSSNTLNILGKPGENNTLRLDAIGTDISLMIKISLQECPPGYTLDDNYTCHCSASTYYGLLKCDPNAYIRYGVWMGQCGQSSLCTADCPVGYCAYNTSGMTRLLYNKLPMQVELLEEAICSPTRTGIICGSCKPNHSVYYNSWYYRCGKDIGCHLGPVLFFLSTILPLSILFIIIALSDANLAGNWNGFLLYTQLVHNTYVFGNGTIRLPHTEFRIIGWLMYVYGIFNLEFFETDLTDFCIWKGANTLDIMMTKLASICFSLILILITVCFLNHRKITNYFSCLMRRRYSVINGISTFLLLCYSQCVIACFKVLVPTSLFDSNHNSYRTVIWHNGDMEPFKGEHVKYGIVAVVFMSIVVILPPLLLFSYPLFFNLLGVCNMSESRVVLFVWRIMPIQLLDSFQNPFKDNCRFFAGLYFFYRVLFPTLHVTVRNMEQYYTGVELTLLVVLVLHAAFQPYSTSKRNKIDLLLFFNLAIFNGVSEYMYMSSTTSKDSIAPHLSLWAAVLILQLLLPLLCAAAYLIAKIAAKMQLLRRVGYMDLQMSV